MIQIEMSDDITKFETKVWGTFTMRQLVCIIIGAFFSIPLALLIPGLDITFRILLFSLIMAPFIFCGYFKSDGATAEILALRFIYKTMLTPAKRKLVQPNWLEEGIKQMEEEDEKKKIMKLTPSQQKKYYRKKNDKTVHYSSKPALKVYK